MNGKSESLLHVNGFLTDDEENSLKEKAKNEQIQLSEVPKVNESVQKKRPEHEFTLFTILFQFFTAILSSQHDSSLQSRIRAAFSQYGPLLPQAIQNSGSGIVNWVLRGSPFRAILVISVGTIIFLSLGGFLFLMLFIVAATVNAIIVSFFLSLAVAGGFLAFFFSCVTAIYVGAVSVAAFVISTFTIMAVFAVLAASGWIGFFWFSFFMVKKTVGGVKSLFVGSGAADSACSSSSITKENLADLPAVNVGFGSNFS